MNTMTQNSPESALNGHPDPAAGSMRLGEGFMTAEAQAAQNEAAQNEQAASEPERPPAIADDLCCPTVRWLARSVELTVPIHAPLINLLPDLVGRLGDEDLSVAVLGPQDGDVVHLRPRADQLTPFDFDDLLDGVARTVRGSTRRSACRAPGTAGDRRSARHGAR